MRMLRCTKCNHDLPEEDFSVDRGYTRGRSYSCRDCENLWQNCRRYGISIEQYWVMHESQDGVCAICKQPERMILKRSGNPRMLGIDHDHVSGEVRGLLCGPCNQAIGQLRDDPELCIRAAEYLISSQIPTATQVGDLPFR